jgi:hypothetical protein
MANTPEIAEETPRKPVEWWMEPSPLAVPHAWLRFFDVRVRRNLDRLRDGVEESESRALRARVA